jgi:hypothetical protein
MVGWSDGAVENETAKQHQTRYSNLLKGAKMTSLLDIRLIVAADDGS